MLFEVDEDRLDEEMTHIQSIGVVGSSELTDAGLGLAGAQDIHEELCYEIAGEDLDGSTEYLLKLAGDALALEDHIQRHALH